MQRRVRRIAAYDDLRAHGAPEDEETGDQSWSSGGSTSDESGANVAGRQRALEARRRNRWRRYHRRAEGLRRRGASLLEENAVTPKTLVCYRREL